MLVVSIVAMFWMQIEFLNQSFKVYFGWFDWGTIATWTPVILSGAFGAISVILLVSSTKAKFWGLSAGVLMSTVAAVFYGTRIGDPGAIGLTQTSFLSIWPLMYFVGALIVSNGALKLKNHLAQLRTKAHISIS